MYEELLRCLREHAKPWKCADNCICRDAAKRGYGSCSDELAKLAADAIEELSKKRESACWGCKCEKIEPSRWIPVTERCPEKSGDYLVFDDCRNLYVNEWHCLLKKWQYDDSRITHWMPLPEAPNEEREDADS